MSRRFQYPAVRALAKLKMLQEPTMILVCGTQILFEKPAAIRRNVKHCIELVRHERRSHQPNALLRNLRANWMHVVEIGCEPFEVVTIFRCPLNSLFLAI